MTERKRKLIPYAGYEPNSGPRGKRRGINAKRALELRALGYSWQKIADTLADEVGTEKMFRGESVREAVGKYVKRGMQP